jgi:hypothetical protein
MQEKSNLNFQLACLILGQLLFSCSTFFWTESGTYSVNSATFMFLSMVFWALGFVGLFGQLSSQLPIYSRIGLLYALYGAFGGAAFAMEGLFIEVFGLSEKAGVEASESFPLALNLIMYQSGPAFPLSLLILGIVLAYKKKVNWVSGLLLSSSGLAFPLGRILRKIEVAHLTDFLLLVAVLWISLQLRKRAANKV